MFFFDVTCLALLTYYVSRITGSPPCAPISQVGLAKLIQLVQYFFHVARRIASRNASLSEEVSLIGCVKGPRHAQSNDPKKGSFAHASPLRALAPGRAMEGQAGTASAPAPPPRPDGLLAATA
jgi:hypothetical protein